MWHAKCLLPDNKQNVKCKLWCTSKCTWNEILKVFSNKYKEHFLKHLAWQSPNYPQPISDQDVDFVLRFEAVGAK